MLTYADGMNALMQARLKELFVDVVEAFVFLDQNGDDSISAVEPIYIQHTSALYSIRQHTSAYVC
jgi:hypothetical protein